MVCVVEDLSELGREGLEQGWEGGSKRGEGGHDVARVEPGLLEGELFPEVEESAWLELVPAVEVGPETLDFEAVARILGSESGPGEARALELEPGGAVAAARLGQSTWLGQGLEATVKVAKGLAEAELTGR